MNTITSQNNDGTDKLEKNTVVNILTNFWVEMKHWELSCFKELKNFDQETEDINTKEEKFSYLLSEIYKKYCTPRKRKQTRLGSYGDPSAYNPDSEKVLDIINENHNRMVLLTEKQLGVKTQYKYVILRRNQKWLIDNRQRFDENGRWKRDIL